MPGPLPPERRALPLMGRGLQRCVWGRRCKAALASLAEAVAVARRWVDRRPGYIRQQRMHGMPTGTRYLSCAAPHDRPVRCLAQVPVPLRPPPPPPLCAGGRSWQRRPEPGISPSTRTPRDRRGTHALCGQPLGPRRCHAAEKQQHATAACVVFRDPAALSAPTTPTAGPVYRHRRRWLRPLRCPWFDRAHSSWVFYLLTKINNGRVLGKLDRNSK